jgi:transposase
MPIFGIDPAAETFVAARYPRAGTSAATFDNSAEGVRAFLDWTEQNETSLAAHLPSDSSALLVAVECTGVYSERICYALHHAFEREGTGQIVLLDATAVSRAFPRGAKTDALDSARIAEYAHRYADRIAPWRPQSELTEQVRVLLSTREQLTGQRTASLNARRSLSRKVVQTPGANAALDSVAAHIKEQIKALDAELTRLIGSDPDAAAGVSLLSSVPGVAMLLSAQMLVLTSCFSEVPRARSLAQRLGIAPNAHESGTSVRGRRRSRGYGPGAVRKLLHLAARSVRTHETRWREYFESKVAAGKPKTLVLNNMANRLVRVMCAVLRSGVPYRPDHVSISPTLLTSHRQSG